MVSHCYIQALGDNSNLFCSNLTRVIILDVVFLFRMDYFSVFSDHNLPFPQTSTMSLVQFTQLHSDHVGLEFTVRVIYSAVTHQPCFIALVMLFHFNSPQLLFNTTESASREKAVFALHTDDGFIVYADTFQCECSAGGPLDGGLLWSPLDQNSARLLCIMLRAFVSVCVCMQWQCDSYLFCYTAWGLDLFACIST